MKRKGLLIGLFVLMMLFVTGCGKKYANGEVYVYNWGEYIDEDVIEMFEEEYDIKVIYNEFETNEDMYPLVESGAVKYDVICPSDYMVSKMLEKDLLQEIDKSAVPNLKNIDPEYLKSAETFDPGNKYCVPYCWGTMGILYDKTKVTAPIDSWSAIFDPQYKGEILMMDSVRDAFAAALRYLGYSLNSKDEKELEAAKKLLQEQNPLVQAYVVDQVRDKMIGGEAILGVIYSGEAIYVKRENPNLEYVIPKEGSNVWIDGWVVPKNAPNTENAMKWINFMCRGDIALKNFEAITYSTPNTVAREMIEDEDIKYSLVAFPTTEMLNRCEAFVYLGEATDEVYMKKWNEVKMEK